MFVKVRRVAGYLRIGELSRRSGVAPELLRAWERRYGLLSPSRSTAGYRLYGDDDLVRVRAMQTRLKEGLSAAEAAVSVLSAPAVEREPGDRTKVLRAELRSALESFDDAAAHAVIDRALAELTTDSVLGEIVLPFLAELGARWESGEVGVGHEHFASSLLRGRLLGLARGWDRGPGPRAVLACAPGELHDLPLIVFGLALRERGWRITYLGADTPVKTVAETAQTLDPELVVVSATLPAPLRAAGPALTKLARKTPLVLAGAGAPRSSTVARVLTGDPLVEADRVTRELQTKT
jgi:MerR family transcriptional regulator, light-induced transcriptional regulator